jgi:superfamily II DNA or RNA helicase
MPDQKNPLVAEKLCDQLREENAMLRRVLSEHGIEIPPQPPEPAAQLAPNETQQELEDTAERARKRISLFRSLFRGREDVFAVRWESHRGDGKSGYMPAAERDWNAINRSRPEDRKQVDRKTRRFLPLTDKVIEDHLWGRHTIGVYPLLADETCWFLAVDFDKTTWQQDAIAYLETCTGLDVPAAFECSRSGNGGHVWIFFDRAVSAMTARKLGCLILTKTMEQRHQIGLDSYDRFFPNQDTMPKGGLGNLIALPLQYGPRKQGRSVFIDRHLQPYPDQWAFLAGIRRMDSRSAEDLVRDAQRKGDLIGVRISLTDDEDGKDPWTLPPSRKRLDRPIDGPLPESIQVIRSNLVYLEKLDLPSAMLNRILRLAAFQNPEFYKAQAMRLATYDKPRVIGCGQDFERHVAVPRGCLSEVLALLYAHKIRPEIRDERFSGTAIEANFQGALRPAQHEAVARIIEHDDGICCAPTAFGKTAVASWLIAHRRVNTLILVHRQQLLDQWRERLAMFLGVPVELIGQIGGGKTERKGLVDVAVIQSLYQKNEVKDFVAEYGHVIIDECHHISAFTFEQVMKQVKAKYVLGLTATPTRKDGHHPIIYMQCGPTRFNMNAKAMTESTPFEHRVTPRHTDFRLSPELSEITIQDIYRALIDDPPRNAMIATDLLQTVQDGRSPLLLSGRVAHLNYFASKLKGVIENVFVLKGGTGKKQRRVIAEALASVPDGSPRVILATGSYIGEGFDDARLDTLFLAMPISWKGTLQQYVGRLHRLHDNKRVVRVYDYVDGAVPMLARMFERRLKGYAAIGYTIDQHVSAVEF